MATVSLYVESDLAMFASAAKMLSRNGFILHVAENGREGLRLFTELRPNVVISELNLPGMSGVEMVRQIRKKGIEGAESQHVAEHAGGVAGRDALPRGGGHCGEQLLLPGRPGLHLRGWGH